MPLNTVVREKRKEQGLTQEQVAEYLGVSTPAVNKWEKGSTYPDITLLPNLARLLKTDLNTLLCFHQELSSKEIRLFTNHVAETFLKKGFEGTFAMAIEKIQEYPYNAELINSLAMLLEGSLISAELNIKQKSEYEEQISSLYERVVNCNDAVYSNMASYMLASRWIAAKKYDKAQKILNELPEHNVLDKRNLQARLWTEEGKIEQAAELLEHKLLSILQETLVISTSIAQLLIKEGDEESAIYLAQCAQKEVEMFGLWGYSAFIVSLETAVSRKNVKDSISVLQNMLAAMFVPWEINKSPVFKHIHQKQPESNFGAQFLSMVLSELETSAQYDFLREEADFQQLLSQYRSKK